MLRRIEIQRREATPEEETDKVAKLSDHYREILTGLGEDVTREGLVDTPRRAAKAMRFLTRGYRQNLDDLINNAVFTSDTDEMVIVRNIEMYSLCEHHMLPFIGQCNVAYLPQGKVLGLSKVARLVEIQMGVRHRCAADAIQLVVNGRAGQIALAGAQRVNQRLLPLPG